MDFNEYTDEQLDALIREARTEKERRENLAHIPEQMSTLAKTYVKGGGDPNVLIDVVNGDTGQGAENDN